MTTPITATALLPLAMAWLGASMTPAPWQGDWGIFGLTRGDEAGEIDAVHITDDDTRGISALRNMLAPLCKYIEWLILLIPEAMYPTTGASTEALAQAVLDAMQAAMPEMYAAWLAEVEAGR